MFNWDDEAEAKAGYTAAVEEWLDVSLSGIDEHKHIRRHAMAVATRMIRGPLRPPT